MTNRRVVLWMGLATIAWLVACGSATRSTMPTVLPTATWTLTPLKTATPSPSPSATFTKTLLPTATHTATATSLPTDTPRPTNTRKPTSTPTATLRPPTSTPTSAPPTNTPVPPTNTPVPPTNTPSLPTNTPVPPTNTAVPATNTPVPAVADVIISGVYNSSYDEHLTLTNRGTGAQDMSGWSVTGSKGEERYTFPGGYVLGPGASVKLYSGKNGVDAWPTDIYWTDKTIWNNSGETAFLWNAQGAEVSRYSW